MSDASSSRISASAAFEALHEGAILIDTRGPNGRGRHGELRTALIIPKEDIVNVLTNRLRKTAPEQKVILFCTSTKGSAPIVEDLLKAGVQEVHDVEGGFDALIAAGFERVIRQQPSSPIPHLTSPTS